MGYEFCTHAYHGVYVAFFTRRLHRNLICYEGVFATLSQTFPQLERTSELSAADGKAALVHGLEEIHHVMVIAAVESVLKQNGVLKGGVAYHFVLIRQ